MGPKILNDHQWVSLGQGNTVALLAGWLTIGGCAAHDKALDASPADARVGLFAKEGRILPAMVRFSDVRPDDYPVLRLSRMAIKLHAPETWCKETNMTTAETVDPHSLANFEQVGDFVGDPAKAS